MSSWSWGHNGYYRFPSTVTLFSRKTKSQNDSLINQGTGQESILLIEMQKLNYKTWQFVIYKTLNMLPRDGRASQLRFHQISLKKIYFVFIFS